MNKTTQRLRMDVQDWAAEDARKDLAFVGNDPFKGIPADKIPALREALVYYARNAAARTFDTLNLRGQLRDCDDCLP